MKIKHSVNFCFFSLICIGIFSACLALAEENPKGVIRNIQIEIRDIFDEPNLESFYRVANQLKIRTLEQVIRRELLFTEGENYDHFKIEESERNLRSLSFVHNIKITPVFDGGFVDLKVSVQDTWTVIPQVSYSSGDGGDKLVLGVSETDLGGLGKRLELLYADIEGRQELQGIWEDNRFFDSYHRLFAAYFDRSDGDATLFSFGRPFRSLIEKEAWAANIDISDGIERLYEGGDESFIFREKVTDIGAQYTIARGDPESVLRRYSFGYEYLENRFFEATDEDFRDVDIEPTDVSRDPALLAEGRRYSGPVFSFRRIIPDFISTNYVDRFERVQDFNLGSQFIVNGMVAPEVIGSSEDTVQFSTAVIQGKRFSPSSFIRGGIGANTRLNDGGAENSGVWLEIRYANVMGESFLNSLGLGKHTIAGAITMDYNDDLDKDVQLLLGARNGLRGYKAKALTGDKRFIFSIEDRFHVYQDVLKIFSVGGAAFFDAGGLTDGDYLDIFEKDFYADIGAGLRFGFPRFSGGGVFRVDVALPLRDGPDGSGTFEPRILFTAGVPFSSSIRAEDQINDQRNAEIGVD